MRTFNKSSKLDNVLYDVRGPVVDEAARMEEEGKNKDWIQDNVDDSTDNCSHHTDLGKSLSCNEGIHAQYDQYKKASEDIDSGIVSRVS